MKIKYWSGKTVFFHVYNNYVAKKICTFKIYLNSSPTNHNNLLKWQCAPIHIQYTFNNLTENFPQSTTNKAYPFPPPVTNWTCQHLSPFSPTQKCYFPFIQTIYSVAVANLHTFVKVPRTHTENSFTKQHLHLIKYAEMNQKRVSLNPCH